jgi:hypothetical protein
LNGNPILFGGLAAPELRAEQFFIQSSMSGRQ